MKILLLGLLHYKFYPFWLPNKSLLKILWWWADIPGFTFLRNLLQRVPTYRRVLSLRYVWRMTEWRRTYENINYSTYVISYCTCISSRNELTSRAVAILRPKIKICRHALICWIFFHNQLITIHCRVVECLNYLFLTFYLVLTLKKIHQLSQPYEELYIPNNLFLYPRI